MRLTDLLDKEHSFRYLIGLVLAVAFFVAVWVPSRSLAVFYDNLEGLSDSVQRADYETAEQQLAEVSAFYEGSRAWGVQQLVDSYLFQDAFLQQASYSYLTGDLQTVVDDLSDEVDDARASHLLANAKFLLARERYRAIDGEDPDAARLKEAIIVEVMETINPDYERALRSDLTDRFDYKWNYDLTSNPEAVRRALEAPREIEPPELEQMKGEGTPVRRRRG
ncbi:MAG: hypothetical protein CL483_07705 [Acidobacteria bacterium]|nr:hypothetical protein [Acidobacteriota bacterium]|tara:strand:- start:1952 stop:2617 length:666 start_codon:yes stop_codon:yes gene_type:complete